MIYLDRAVSEGSLRVRTRHGAEYSAQEADSLLEDRFLLASDVGKWLTAKFGAEVTHAARSAPDQGGALKDRLRLRDEAIVATFLTLVGQRNYVKEIRRAVPEASGLSDATIRRIVKRALRPPGIR